MFRIFWKHLFKLGTKEVVKDTVKEAGAEETPMKKTLSRSEMTISLSSVSLSSLALSDPISRPETPLEIFDKADYLLENA
jgi:hypothetical protein